VWRQAWRCDRQSYLPDQEICRRTAFGGIFYILQQLCSTSVWYFRPIKEVTVTFITETAVARAESGAQDYLRPERVKDSAGFKIDPDFFPDLVHMK
jgi:hypothetical protein